ncbi:MAG TPA: molybdenum cofactor biosynthesis protein MoaE [Aestuariivirgaceae bacterium]|nr:molybdenum cofactor biosynthesis protein MoaE [Aestuariivirgaceae bacterium]
MMIRVQREALDATAELKGFRQGGAGAGSTVMFLGTVREMTEDGAIEAMTLEHYPGMTERALKEIEAEAHKRWPLLGSLIIHRYGKLLPGEDIVLAITQSAHRAQAFEACAFLVDYLKTSAPFWKLEETSGRTRWVEARDSDDAAAARWKNT